MVAVPIHQTVIKQSSNSHQTVIKQSSKSQKHKLKKPKDEYK